MSQNKSKTYIFFANQQLKIYHNQFKEIEDEVQNELNCNPSDINCLLIKIQILYKYYLDYKQALIIIKDLLQINTENIDARLDLVQIMIDFKAGTYQDCFHIIEECFELDKSYWRTSFIKIRILEAIGGNDERINNEIQRCLEEYPENIWFKIYYAQILSESEINHQQLNELLDKIRSNTILDFDLYRRLSYCYGNMKEGKHSINFVLQSILLNPRSYISYNEYAFLQRIINEDCQKCIEYCQKAIELNSRYVFSYNNIASAYRQLNQLDNCIKYLNKTLILENKPFTYHQLIYDYYDSKQKDTAKYYSYKNVRKYPYHVYSNYLQQKLHRITFNNKIDDFELQEFQSIKCLNFNSLEMTDNEYEELTTSINEVYQNDQNDEDID